MARLEQSHQLPVRGARRTRGMRVSTQLAEINVVPLVDVMLVLLVIFMVAAPMMQQGYGIHLPQAKKAAPLDATPVTVSIPSTFARDQKLLINEDIVPIGVLRERIRQALKGQMDRNVIVQGDASVTLQDFATVMSLLQDAGVEKLGFPTQPISKGGR